MTSMNPERVRAARGPDEFRPSKEEAKAIALVKLRGTPRYQADPAFALAVAARFSKLPEDLKKRAEDQFAMFSGLTEPVRRGRRLDLEAEYERRRMENPDETPPLFVKVLIAGSGYNGWETQVDAKGVVKQTWNRADDAVDEEQSTQYTKDDKGKGSELMFAGPGGSQTKGTGNMSMGTRDAGSNSIEALVANVPPLIEKAIETGLKEDRDRSVIVLIKAHSRGAVASGRIAKIVKDKYPEAEVELTQIDPVPGQQQTGENVEIDLRKQDDSRAGLLDEHTLVYSVASGWNLGSAFTPQKVHGAKRIIVSQQNHSVGLKNGFTYEGEIYKGSSLNSLAEGVYVDLNKDGKNAVPLVRVADMKTAQAKIQQAYKASSAWTGDTHRLDIIASVLTELFDAAG